MAYTITIETLESSYSMMPTQTLNVLSFETKAEAQKEIKRLIKEDGYKKYSSHIYNSELSTELFTNY